MTRRDQGIVGVLAAAFVILAIVVALPSVAPNAAPTATTPTPVATAAPRGSDGGAAAASGSSPGPSEAASAPTDQSSGSPAPVPVIRHGVVGSPTSINPLTARRQSERDLVALVFSGLVKLGQRDAIVPDLADRWSADKTGTHWTFHLRANATWHDNHAVSADDVVFTVRLLRDPGYTGPLAGSWSEITVKKIDKLTVRFDLLTPLADFLQLARQPLLPAHLLSNVSVADLADSAFSAAPVGSGPYRLLEWDDSVALLERADALATTDGPSAISPPGAAGSAQPARIQLQFYSTASALADAYRAGEVDMADGLPAATAQQLAALPGTHLIRDPRSTLTAVLFNLRTNHPTIRDERVRQALLQAVDRPRLVADVLAGFGRRADSLLPPQSWAYVARSAKPVPYSTKRAAQLLKAAGWRKVTGHWHTPGSKKIFTLQIITLTRAINPVVYAAAQFVASSWRSFGVTVTVAAVTPNALAQRLAAANFTAAVVDVNIGLDPDLYPLLASRQAGSGGSNLSGVQSLVLDDLLVAARKPGTLAQRRGAWANLEAFLAASQVILPLAFRDDPMVVSDRVIGPAPHLQGDLSDRFWDVLTWRLASGG